MSDSVQMPALGESVTEGTVTRWLKSEGDQVAVDEPLLEVSTRCLFTNTTPASSIRIVVNTSGFNLHWLQFTGLLPMTPAGLKAGATTAQVQLNWNSVPGATSYQIKRASTSGGSYQTIASGVTVTNYTDAAITNGAPFFYVVTAINSYGESARSNEASVAVPFPQLAARVSAANVLLSWSNPASSMLLRSTTSLTPPIVWQPVTNPPVFQHGLWQLYWPPADSARFFRLSVD